MGKVSIGLRGWRFEEDEVFDESGSFRSLEEMPEDTAHRLSRLTNLVTAPCDACWLVHGDEGREDANVAAVVYGEPDYEVLLCEAHEDDFLYWYREEGGAEYRGDPAMQDAFHEWFADGGRAPGNYDGIEHVETDPGDIPAPGDIDMSDVDPELPDERKKRIDLRNMEVREGADAERDERDEGDPVPLDDADVDLTTDYPG
jgi:hypothetical protein